MVERKLDISIFTQLNIFEIGQRMGQLWRNIPTEIYTKLEQQSDIITNRGLVNTGYLSGLFKRLHYLN